MSSLDLADELQARVDALRAVGRLEEDLLAAKATGDKDAVRAAAEVLREARSLTRTEGISVGGDAFISNPEEG